MAVGVFKDDGAVFQSRAGRPTTNEASFHPFSRTPPIGEVFRQVKYVRTFLSILFISALRAASILFDLHRPANLYAGIAKMKTSFATIAAAVAFVASLADAATPAQWRGKAIYQVLTDRCKPLC